MTDPYKLAAMRILSRIWGSAYMALPALIPLTVLQIMNLSVTSGNTSISAFGYACYGLILVEVVRYLQAGYKFGQLGVTVLSRFYDREVESKTLEVFNAFVRHWKDHVKETLPPLMQGYQSGLDTGDLEFVAYCGYVYCYYSYSIGKQLSSLEKRIATHVDLLGQIKQETVRNYSRMLHQATLNLMGNPDQGVNW